MVNKKRNATPKSNIDRKIMHPGIYPELNERFYRKPPSIFFTLQLATLTSWGVDMEARQAFIDQKRKFGAFIIGGIQMPDEDELNGFLGAQGVIAFHHAAETVFRYYFAHYPNVKSPWLHMSKETSFVKFKQRVEQEVKNGFKQEDIAHIFYGGATSKEAAVDSTEEEFEESVEALKKLLHFAAQRYLSESFLYNAAKHGLTAIPASAVSRLSYTSPDGQEFDLSYGYPLTHLHTKDKPQGVESDTGYVTTTSTLFDQDLIVVYFLARALDDIWTNGRRKHLAQSGQITMFTNDAVDVALYGAIESARQLVRSMTWELQSILRDGTVPAMQGTLNSQFVPKDWKGVTGEPMGVGLWETSLEVRPIDQESAKLEQAAKLPEGQYLFPF